MAATVDEVADLTVRDFGDDRAARAAQQAATGRLGEIARIGRSVHIHLVCSTRRPDAEWVPWQTKANLDDRHTRAGQSAPMRPGEEFQAVACSGEDSPELLLARWGSSGVSPTTGPVTQRWENTRSTSDGHSGPS
ncbi:MAG: hypothetical protein ACYDC5_10665 [Candidatus Dormibacteria bacterium]